jgi:hypothetical protein
MEKKKTPTFTPNATHFAFLDAGKGHPIITGVFVGSGDEIDANRIARMHEDMGARVHVYPALEYEKIVSEQL